MRRHHLRYWLDTLGHDVSFAGRLIRRSPILSATILTTLTVGIALNVSVFSLVNGLLLRPWVRSEPETFVSVFPQYSGDHNLRYSDGGMSQPDYVRLRDSAASLSALSAFRLMNATLGGPESGNTRAALVSCDVTSVLRPDPPIMGRYFTAEECDLSNRARVAVESTWRTRFSGSADLIGRTIYLNRQPFAVMVFRRICSCLDRPLIGAVGSLHEMAAIWIPARRAASLDPLVSLRYE